MAVSVTVLPLGKVALHAEPPEPQFIAVGFDVIVPFVGLGEMVNVGDVAKLAVHVLLAVIVMVHVVFVPQEAQSPPHPTKTEPASGVAVSVTVLPLGKSTEHAEPPEPQFIPPGLEVTLPFVGLGLIDRIGPPVKLALSLATKAS